MSIKTEISEKFETLSSEKEIRVFLNEIITALHDINNATVSSLVKDGAMSEERAANKVAQTDTLLKQIVDNIYENIKIDNLNKKAKAYDALKTERDALASKVERAKDMLAEKDVEIEKTKKATQNELKKKLLTWRINKAFYLPHMSLISKLVTVITMILFPSIKGAINKREKLYKSVPKGDRVVNNSGAWLSKEIIPREWVQSSVEMKFEGISVNVSDKYDEWLTYVYGDYMSLPPENERVGHHYVDIFDMNKSYTEYIK